MTTLHDQLSSVYHSYLSGSSGVMRKTANVVAFDRSATYLSDNYHTVSDGTIEVLPANSFQTIIRPLFGRHGSAEPAIGDHPDFSELNNTRQHVFCAITTMFMDIESSTRLSLIYPLEEVYRIKNSFIRAAIEVVRSFDGHVHRIMGDAVMAYFGGKHVSPDVGIINGINCAATLQYFTDRIVIPMLNKQYDDLFGIRIGLDFGKKDDVLWSSYGYPNMNEVTATSFYVDVASKLQHSARKNQIMIGHSLKSYIDFPDKLLDIKEISIDGKKVRRPFLEPNHTNQHGNPINYQQYELRWKDYLSLTPFAAKDAEFFGANPGYLLRMELHETKGSMVANAVYYSCGTIIPKNKWIKFLVTLPFQPRLPYEIAFSVENHGLEAKNMGGSDLGNHSEVYEVRTQGGHNYLRHWEQSLYRGLHYMKIDIITNLGTKSIQSGVYIE